MFIHDIQFCLLSSSLVVINPFRILFPLSSPITFPLACQAFSTFIRPSITFFSSESWCNACHNHFSIFVLVLSSVSFVLLQVAVTHHWFCTLSKISLAFFTRCTRVQRNELNVYHYHYRIFVYLEVVKRSSSKIQIRKTLDKAVMCAVSREFN